MDLTGDADGPPTPIGTFAVDYLAAMQFAIGMMAALAARERTGEGQVVDACLLNAALTMHHQEATAFLNTGRRYPRMPFGIAHAHNTPLYATYECADGRWLVLIAEFYITEPWQRVARALELDAEVTRDSRFETVDAIEANAEAAHQALREAFGRHDRETALRRLAAEDVLAAPVNSYPEVFEDPQIQHNGMIMDAERPETGPIQARRASDQALSHADYAAVRATDSG